MSKNVIGFVILALVFFFPFRWVYLEYPDPVLSKNTMIDAGRIEYVFYFLLCVVGFITFSLLTTAGKENAKH